MEIEEIEIAFMFNTKPILFCITVKIYRSDEYMDALVNGPHVAHHNLNLNSKPDKEIITLKKLLKRINV